MKELADTIDGLLERLESAFEQQRRFVANASHELRTPLAMMRTSLDVAIAKPDPPPEHLHALERNLREGLDQADRLLESFLDLARSQNGALRDETTVSLAAAAAAAIATCRHELDQSHIEVNQALADAPVTGSETLLARMAGNLIDNAIRHNEPHGWIRVETSAVDGAARLIVENGGQRLDEKVVRELAQPFRRLSAERTGSENGVGLGLSIVAAIAAAHNGSLHLRARAEGGLHVLVELPRARGPAIVGEPA